MLTNYRLPLFTELADRVPLDVIHSPDRSASGFDVRAPPDHPRIRWIEVPTRRPFGHRIGMVQSGIGAYMRRERPDAVIHFANPRYLSFWNALLTGRALGIPVYPHGHGLRRRRRVRWTHRLLYRAILALCTRYICYTPSVAASLRALGGVPPGKLAVADNAVANPCPAPPEEKTGGEKGLMFIGRLRPGCGIGLLIDAVARLRETTCPGLVLHAIGDGELMPEVREGSGARPWLHLHGAVYDAARIREIARDCFAGVYPGRAGLSVVHMMSLSLPPITHDDPHGHEGPEPDSIVSGHNGLLYDHRDPSKALAAAIHKAFTHMGARAAMQRAAFATYETLTKPSLAARIADIIGCPQGGGPVR